MKNRNSKALLLVAGATGWAGLLCTPTATASCVNGTHTITQSGLSFDPPQITVQPGDLVVWIHSAGSHTVTSGVDCLHDGRYFNAPLDTRNPTFEWEVPGDLEGDVPYFCIPHCGAGMTGTITVEPANACPEDLDGCGIVDFNDLLILLANWGPCEGECPFDIDESGAIDFGDILRVLAAWGPCPS